TEAERQLVRVARRRRREAFAGGIQTSRRPHALRGRARTRARRRPEDRGQGASSGAKLRVFGQELEPRPLGLRPIDQWEDSGIGEAYGLDELAADVIAVADDVGADQLVLVGFSMSGKFAQYVSARYP